MLLKEITCLEAISKLPVVQFRIASQKWNVNVGFNAELKNERMQEDAILVPK